MGQAFTRRAGIRPPGKAVPHRVKTLFNRLQRPPHTTRRSALALIPREVQVELPTAPSRQPDAIRIDYEWWAERGDELQAEFERWLIRRPIYDFHDPDRN